MQKPLVKGKVTEKGQKLASDARQIEETKIDLVLSQKEAAKLQYKKDTLTAKIEK